MSSPPPERLRAALSAMPSGTLVPRDWVLAQLAGGSSAPAESPAPIDRTIGDLGRLFGRRPSTVRAWVERGDFPGAYKLHGKQWRVPPSGIEAFQRTQQRTRSASGLSAWRSRKHHAATTRPASGPQQVAKRSPTGHAED